MFFIIRIWGGIVGWFVFFRGLFFDNGKIEKDRVLILSIVFKIL